MDVGAWVSVGCAVVAAMAAVAASLRDRSKDSDQHIDERIELAVGSRLTKIEAAELAAKLGVGGPDKDHKDNVAALAALCPENPPPAE